MATKLQQQQRPLVFCPATGPCTVCGKKSDQACARCRVDFYCGKEHQTQDWKRHKKGCGVFELRVDETLGRHLVATKDIPAGTVLMRETPLVSWPNYRAIDLDAQTVCVGCCSVLPLAQWSPCPRCGWPVCGEDCSQRREHLPECVAFQRAGYRLHGAPTVAEWYPHAALRLCLASKDLMLGDYMVDMQSGFPSLDAKNAPEDFKCIYEATAAEHWAAGQGVAVVLQGVMGLGWLSPEELRHWSGVALVNAFDCSHEKRNGVERTDLYAGATLLEHACVPNVVAWPDTESERSEPSGRPLDNMVVTVRDVAQGEHLTVSYLEDPFRCKADRREYLATNWGFHCACALCRDPTEGGLHLAAWYCSYCKARGGKWLVQLDADGARWRCEGCGRGGSVHDPLAYGEPEDPGCVHAAELGLRATALLGGESDVSLSQWEEFLAEALWPNGPLHPTSQVVLQVKSALIHYEPQDPREAALLAGYCRDLLAAGDALCAGNLELQSHPLRQLRALLWLRMRNAGSAFHTAVASGAPPGVVHILAQEVQAIKQEIVELLPRLETCALTLRAKEELIKWQKSIGAALREVV